MEVVRAAAVVSNSFGCVQNSGEGCGFRSGREGGEVKRIAVRASGFADRSHEAFYSLRVRCGKKEKAGKVAKVREMVKSVRRDLWPLQSASVQQAAVLAVELESESPSQFVVCNPNVIEDALKQLAEIEAELESLKVKSKKKGSSSSSSSSSSCSSSESSDSDMGPAMDMRALRKSKKHVKQLVVSPDALFQVQTAPESTSAVMLPSVQVTQRSVGGNAPQASSFTNDEEEPAIIAQIRALCNSANLSTATPRVISTNGPLTLKDTPTGRVIVETSTSSWTPVIPTVPAEVSTSGQVEVCMGGKCKKGGAQQILASLQGSIPESSNISVTSCKCMGKCKSAANVRVTKDDGASQLHSHVAPDDVDTLLEFHFGLGASVGSQSGDVRLPVYARIDSGLAIA